MSRTPIRHILQCLSYALMVETQVGFGTIAVPLVPENRDQDIETLSALCLAAASMATDRQIDADIVVRLVGIQTWLEVSDDRRPEDFVHLMARLIRVVRDVVDDRILSNALENAFWRVLRWRVVDINDDPELHWQKLSVGIEAAVAAAKTRDAATYLRTAAKLGARHKSNHIPELDLNLP